MKHAAGLRIEGALVVPGGGMAPFEGWVEVAGPRIVAVGEGDASLRGEAAAVIDGRGCVLMPGFVNAHGHSHSSLTRGSAEGMALAPWIAAIEREQGRLGDAEAEAAALATYAEALLSGTTTFVDMCLRPEPAMRAARAAGLRVVVAPYVLDGRDFAPQLADVRALLERHGAGDGRITLWVGLHDLESCADATIRDGAALAREHGTGVHLHCAESRGSLERTRARTGRTPVAQLAALDALGPRTLLAHGVWTDAADHALLADAGASVVHCPHANLKLGSGIAPVPAMRAAGVRVALGSDGAKANNRLDMFDVMKFASLLHKGVHQDAALLPPPQVLAMAAEAGGQALGLDAGVVAPGRLADLVLVGLDSFHLTPATPQTVATNLVHAARGPDVRTVVVDGEVVVRDGRLVRLDAGAVLASMRAAARRLMAP